MPPILNPCHKDKQDFFCFICILPLFIGLSGFYPRSIDERCRDQWNDFVQQVHKKHKDIDRRMMAVGDSIKSPIVGKLSQEKIKELTVEAALLQNRCARLENAIILIDSLEKSTVRYAVEIPSGDEGETTYDKDAKEIVFRVHGPANFIHEITHGGQFEKGKLAYKKDTGGAFGNDAKDEIEAYSMQFAFEPDSVKGLRSSSIPSSFTAITETWLRDLTKADGSKPYAKKGSAHLALKTITIYSGRRRILKAYRYYPDRKTRWPAGYKTLADANMYYKQ